jgi:hypothetical protein
MVLVQPPASQIIDPGPPAGTPENVDNEHLVINANQGVEPIKALSQSRR